MAPDPPAAAHSTPVLLTPAAPPPARRRRAPPPPPSASPALAPVRRTLPDLDRLSSYTDGAFFDCESPRPSSAMLAHTPSVAEIDYHEGAETPVVHKQGATRDSSRPTHVMGDAIGRMRIESLSSDAQSGSNANDDEDAQTEAVEMGVPAQPRAEIILRWKRFAVLVVLSALVLSGVSVYLFKGLVVDRNVPADEAEKRTETINTYSGLLMGFIESIVGLGLEELFPVFLVYLHNLKWYPGDDPAVKEIGKFKKLALTLFIPVFMVAMGSSLSAVQANQNDQTTTTTTRMRARHLQASYDNSTLHFASDLDETILRSVVARDSVDIPLLPDDCTAGSDGFASAASIANALPSARFGFPSRDWHHDAGATFTRLDDDEEETHMSAIVREGERFPSEIMHPSTVYELLLQGREVIRTTRSLPQERSRSALSSQLETLAESFRITGGISNPAIDGAQVTVERITVSPTIEFEGVTVEIQQQDLQIERVCGAQSCILLEASASPLTRVGKGVFMAPYAAHCLSSSRDTVDCDAKDNSAFLYGLSTSTTIQSKNSNVPASDSMEPLLAKRSLVLSFGKLSWRHDDFGQSCDSSLEECSGLHIPLGSSGKHVFALREDVVQSLRRTRRSPFPLAQLSEPPVLNHGKPAQQPLTIVGANITSKADTCIGGMVDAYARYVTDRHLALDALSLGQTMAAAGVFFLLQDGAVTDSAPSVHVAIARRLVTTTIEIEVYLKNTGAGKIMAWVVCGVLLVLSLFVVVLPNERARLEPTKGGNARAERFIAVQTEQIYPNLVYKKRFLIGKTGEEIKFREFAVESVGLHHKMDEDEQIFL